MDKDTVTHLYLSTRAAEAKGVYNQTKPKLLTNLLTGEGNKSFASQFRSVNCSRESHTVSLHQTSKSVSTRTPLDCKKCQIQKMHFRSATKLVLKPHAHFV
eukprot:scaffold138031_cov15-Tisochrysis_lutea.AAC.1